jgi:hypothetical protein
MNNRSNERHQVSKDRNDFLRKFKKSTVPSMIFRWAALEVDNQVRTPDAVDLLIAGTGKQRCQVVWRRSTGWCCFLIVNCSEV